MQWGDKGVSGHRQGNLTVCNDSTALLCERDGVLNSLPFKISCVLPSDILPLLCALLQAEQLQASSLLILSRFTMNPPPPPPMGPLPGFGNQSHLPPGVMPVDDWNNYRGPERGYDQYEQGGRDQRHADDNRFDAMFTDKPKKKDKKFSSSYDQTMVERILRGYVLEQIEPKAGEKLDWHRVGKREMPFEQSKFVQMVKEHRKITKTTGPEENYQHLTSSQQGVVDRLIEEHRLGEHDTRAEWVLCDVQRFGTKRLGQKDIDKIRVILKRQDRKIGRPVGKIYKNATKDYAPYDIIDLTEPLYLADDARTKAKKGGKKKDADWDVPVEIFEVHNDNRPQQAREPFFPPPQMQPRQQDPYFPPPQMQPQAQEPHWPPPQQQGPPYFPQDFRPQPQPFPEPLPSHFGPPHHALPSAREYHPFEPNPEIENRGRYDADYTHRPRSRHTTRSPAPRPHSLSRHDSTRRLKRVEQSSKRMEDKLDFVADKMERWNLNTSSDNSDEGASVFSYEDAAGGGGAWSTPPSSPPLSSRGSLHRRKSIEYRGPRHRSGSAEARRPARSSSRREEERRYVRAPLQPPRRASVRYDDYPVREVAEPRYLPTALKQPRRLTGYEENYPRAEFREVREENRRRQGRGYEGEREREMAAGRRHERPGLSSRRESYPEERYYP